MYPSGAINSKNEYPIPGHSEYVKMVDYGEWTSDGPPGVGSTYREVGKFMGRKIESKIPLATTEETVPASIASR